MCSSDLGANKIGTYGLAVLACAHDIPFYFAAPTSTIDLATPSGAHIPIEERNPAEVTTCEHRQATRFRSGRHRRARGR